MLSAKLAVAYLEESVAKPYCHTQENAKATLATSDCSRRWHSTSWGGFRVVGPGSWGHAAIPGAVVRLSMAFGRRRRGGPVRTGVGEFGQAGRQEPVVDAA